MAKQNMSKKGKERFNKKKPPKGEQKRRQTPSYGGPAAPRLVVKKKKGEHRDRGERKKKGPRAGGEALPLGFSDSSQSVLLVGEGNLSFARALLRLRQGQGANLVATTFDDEQTLLEKYEESQAIVEELQAAGVTVGYGVDATDLVRALKALRKAAARPQPPRDEPGGTAPLRAPLPLLFDRVVFNFPHRGAGIRDQAANVRSNQELLLMFFRGALACLAPQGEVLVTLKSGLPYSLWNVCKLASSATGNGLRLHTALSFDAALLPGYAHRRTHGDDASRPTGEELAGGARTYVWRHAFVEQSFAEA